MSVNNDRRQTLQARLDEAQALQATKHREWKESFSLFEGSWFKQFQVTVDKDATAVNYATSYIKTLVDSVYSRNPFIFMKPRHQRYANFAYSLQRMTNYYWSELNIKRQMKRGVMHAGIYGIGWIETGFTSQIGKLDITDDVGSGVDNGLLDKLLGNSKAPSEQGVLNEYIRSSSPFALSRSPYKVLFAPGYHDIHEMPYIFIAEDISAEDIKNHPLYSKHIDTDVIRPTRVVNSGSKLVASIFNHRQLSGRENGGLFLYRLWHVWDKRNMERVILIDGSDTTIGPFPWSYSHDGFPVVPIIFNEQPETMDDPNAYPQGDLVPMLPLLRELNQLRTAMVRHRKRSGTLIIVPDNMSDEEIKGLKSGDDVSIVRVSAAFIDAIRPHNPPQLAPDVYRINERILSDLDLVGGLSQVILGAGAPKDTLATEINTQTQGSGIRTSAKVDEVEIASVQVAKRLMANIWEFMPREKVRQLLGETVLTPDMWPELPDDPDERREFIQNEIVVEITAGSTQPPKDKTIERKQWLDSINVLMAIAPERIRKDELVKRTLEKFDEPNIDSLITSSDEQHLAAIQQENQLLAQGYPQVVTPDEPHELHLAEHGKLAQQGAATPALDQHIQEHARYYQSQGPMPGRGPQQGDATPQGGSVNPDAKRAGVPNETDLTAPLGRVLSEPGMEKGGIRNV